MPKTALEQWDETAANNTDIGGVNIDEGCAPSGMNNAHRAEMAQIAAWLGDDTVASAATADLGAVPGRYISITGTTTITALGTIKAGTVKYVKFAGILTLTHNATSLILPGAANITTAAGDTAIVVSEGSGNWRCLAYQRASGLPPATAATQAEQETASSTSVYVTPGRQQFHPSAAKVWLKCDAAGNIEASFNVLSIADTGTGLVDVAYTVSFSSTNYAISPGNYDGTNSFQIRITNVSGQATNGCTLKTVNGTALTDPVSWFMSAFGDQ